VFVQLRFADRVEARGWDHVAGEDGADRTSAVGVRASGQWIEYSARTEIALSFRKQRHGGRRRSGAADVCALIGSKPPDAVLLHGPPGGTSQLVLDEERLADAGRLEEVPGIECVVAKELESRAVNVIGSSTRDDVDDGSGRGSILGGEIGCLDLEF